MTNFDAYMARHTGRALVMGGGSALPRDLEGVGCDVCLSVNGHGCELRAPDYVVAMDEVHEVAMVPMARYVRARTPAPLIGPFDSADIRLNWYPESPRHLLAGMVAVYVAEALGCSEVVLAGFDAYGGLPRALEQAEWVARHLKSRVVVRSGPLQQVWSLSSGAEHALGR